MASSNVTLRSQALQVNMSSIFGSAGPANSS
jgi:hypothetical protein